MMQHLSILKLAFFLLLGIVMFQPKLKAQSSEVRRKAYLEQIIRLQERPEHKDGYVNAHDSSWLEWVERTAALPPDFEKIPSIPLLPDPLLMDEGGRNIPVKTKAQWVEKCAWIAEQVKHIISGTFPPDPEKLEVKTINRQENNGVRVEMLELQFGEDERAKLTLEVFTPVGTEGAYPVFMTQWNHRGWAQIALRRGYMAVVYAGADARDDTFNYMSLYPDYDWSTLMRRAWGAHRVVDYLYTLDEVDKEKIAITGHSRNAKQSLLAAAFDPRITAVISSSGGTGGEFPYRYTDERHSNESIEFLNVRRSHWFHPRIRFYAGREHKMPIDQNSLMALIAPNSLLLSSSIREGGGGDPWAIEQMYLSLQQVYDFQDAPQKLGIRLRDGGHGVSARDIESYLDWLDIQFGRSNENWENKLFYNYSFDRWKQLSGENIKVKDFPVVAEDASLLSGQNGETIQSVSAWEQKRAQIRGQIRRVLGEQPAGVEAAPIQGLSRREDYLDQLIERPVPANGRRMNISPYNALGDYQYAALYYPTDSSGNMRFRSNDKLPIVILQHKYSNTGFDAELEHMINRLLEKNIAVLTMDLLGYGSRIEEGTRFYERYPRWSKMGKMVEDTRAAITALQDLDFVDQEQIFLAGYALGGTVSLMTAALDDRVAATAVASAFTPLRSAGSQLEGVQAYSHLYGLLPRMGFFTENTARLPVDFPEIIAAAAPRPMLLIAPTLDRHADHEGVERTAEKVQQVYRLYEAEDQIKISSPEVFNGFSEMQQQTMIDFFEEQASKGGAGIKEHSK